MIEETIHYQYNGAKLKGYLTYSGATNAKRPAIIVAHAWRGQDDFARDKARALAALGYVGFAADLYGDGVNANNNDEAFKLMLPLFLDRKLLRGRLKAAFDTVKSLPMVDGSAIGAIGFCFGGLAAIELLRSGAPVRGIVSFHGLLGHTVNEHRAVPVASATHLHGSLLLLHGYKDPMVSSGDIDTMQREFTNAGIDWQMYIYGEASHAFSNPAADDEKGGMLYNKRTASRSWQAMRNFFEEILPI